MPAPRLRLLGTAAKKALSGEALAVVVGSGGGAVADSAALLPLALSPICTLETVGGTLSGGTRSAFVPGSAVATMVGGGMNAVVAFTAGNMANILYVSPLVRRVAGTRQKVKKTALKRMKNRNFSCLFLVLNNPLTY
jgi:hypothetical protein